MGAFAWIGQFASDLRFGARSLSQTRAFTAIAVGSLALGIGGSTAMYSVIHAVILDPFPYRVAAWAAASTDGTVMVKPKAGWPA